MPLNCGIPLFCRMFNPSYLIRSKEGGQGRSHASRPFPPPSAASVRAKFPHTSLHSPFTYKYLVARLSTHLMVQGYGRYGQSWVIPSLGLSPLSLAFLSSFATRWDRWADETAGRTRTVGPMVLRRADIPKKAAAAAAAAA